MPRTQRLQRNLRAGHLLRRQPHPLGPKGLRRRRSQRLLASLHGRKRLPRIDRTDPGGHRRRPLRRHDRRRLQGLLHHQRTARRPRTPTKAPTSTRPKSPNSGATLSLISTGAGACEPVSNENGAHWNSLESAQLRCRSRSAAVGEWPLEKDRTRRQRRRHPLLPLPRAPRRRVKRHRKPAQPLPRRSRICPALHRHPQPRRPGRARLR